MSDQFPICEVGRPSFGSVWATRVRSWCSSRSSTCKKRETGGSSPQPTLTRRSTRTPTPERVRPWPWTPSSDLPAFVPQEVIRRARSRVGENRYRVLSNNCEHFCEWCLRGESRSYQVECFLSSRTALVMILEVISLVAGKRSRFKSTTGQDRFTDWQAI